MKDIEAKEIISALKTLKASYRNNYAIVADRIKKSSSSASTMYRLHKEMDKFKYYCEAIQQSIDAIKPFIEKFLPNEEQQKDENN